ncbi:PhzF family phenazine biosynthesis isomerase [Synechocystis sp. LKSZ1]|uniref:PhzF family phenazine biosynthesis protein n=1 Tax=Synechocystis sp. LKSZ1 TaxID=3144951 RepID=UPI00336C2B18
MRYPFYTLDVFTDQIFGGNPLAVFPEAEGLSPAQMQKVAAEINYSETVFVFPPTTPQGDYRLRIFTPATELPFAGHPTIGTAFLLGHLGKVSLNSEPTIIVLEEGVGPVAVTLYTEQGQLYKTELTVAQLPQALPDPPSVEILAPILSLSPEQIRQGQERPRCYSCGLPFLFVPLVDYPALTQAQLQQHSWETQLRSQAVNCLYLFTDKVPDNPSAHFQARMFAPSLGIEEDPATGSAVAAFAGYLSQHFPQSGVFSWRVIQGVEMGRPSTLDLVMEQTSQGLQSVKVSGRSVVVSHGWFEIPSAC